MKRTVLLTAVTLGVASAAACNRTDATRQAREAAADVRTVAAEAGERLADGWLTAKVQAKFFADDEIKARYIDVSSRDGAVTLKGFVESDDLRRKAVQLARATDGVAAVTDQLLIGRSPQDLQASAAAPLPTTGSAGGSATAGAVPDDAMVTSLIQARYFIDPALKVRSIDVSTANGVVTLGGEVASDDERARALLLARTTQGVQRVEDGLTVDASLGPAGGAAPAGTSGTLPASPITGAPTAAPAAERPSPAARAPAAVATPGAVGTSGAFAADASLERAIRSSLNGDRELRGADLEVSARDSVVLLQGTVATPAARQRALTLARNADGVTQVIDRIVVQK
jgi:hyperosmotically inducible protein